MKRAGKIFLILILVLCVFALVLSGCQKPEEGLNKAEETDNNKDSVSDMISGNTGANSPAEVGDPSDNDGETENSDTQKSDSDDEPDSSENAPASAEEIGEQLGVSITLPEAEDDKTQEKLDRIDELLNEVYDMQSSYISQLESLEGQAAGEYLDLPDEERTDEKKSEIALKYYNLALGLEGQCDTQMDSICAELQLLLIQVDGDQSIVSDLRTEYSAQKSAMKDEYMSIYGGYLG